MADLIREVDRYVAGHRPPQRRLVLYEPSYYMITYTRLIDVVMTLALRLRGADVRPVLLDEQFSKDFFFGGLYASEASDGYEAIERRLWVDLLHANPLALSDFVEPEDHEVADALAGQATFANYRRLSFTGYPVGLRAADVVANQNNLAEILDRADLIEQLRTHVRHIVRQLRAHERLIRSARPDSIFSNVPFYYRWNIPYRIAKASGTPFYSAMLAERRNTLFFTKDSEVMFDVGPAWESWSKQQLSVETERQLDEFIESRKQGQTDAFSPYPLPGQDTEEHRQLLAWRDRTKRLVVFPVNVAFDAAAYQSSPVFRSLPEMVVEVVRHFREHPELQLVVKAHPAERLVLTMGSDEFAVGMLRNVLAQGGSSLPPNVYFLDWESKIPMADLIPEADLGIVYTSSTAMELAWAGKPVLSMARTHYSGKGFVYEPRSISELWAMAHDILTNGEPDDVRRDRVDLSRKYYYLYFYHARVDFKLFQGDDLSATPTKVLFDDISALLPGANVALDYICDSILDGEPIFAANRWPPATP